jgi:hypothetical protein
MTDPHPETGQEKKEGDVARMETQAEGTDSRTAASVSASSPLVQAWQPIATAPKDGTAVLIGWADCGARPIISEPDIADYERWDCPPTHWMPLPAPPSSDAVDRHAPHRESDEGAHQSSPSSCVSPTDASALRARIEKMRDAANQQIVALTRQADGARRDGLSLGHAFIQGALTIHECYAKELAALLTPTDTE